MATTVPLRRTITSPICLITGMTPLLDLAAVARKLEKLLHQKNSELLEGATSLIFSYTLDKWELVLAVQANDCGYGIITDRSGTSAFSFVFVACDDNATPFTITDVFVKDLSIDQPLLAAVRASVANSNGVLVRESRGNITNDAYTCVMNRCGVHFSPWAVANC